MGRADTTQLEPEGALLALRLFGPFELTVRGDRVAIQRSKVRWLLALLVLWPETPLEREWVQEQIWPDAEPNKARDHLKSHLKLLRQALGEEEDRLLATRTTLAFDTSDVWVDILAFDALLLRPDPSAHAQAVALYRGSLLMSCLLDWPCALRQERERACLKALEFLAEQARAAGDAGAALSYLRRAVVLDPLDERAHLALVELLMEAEAFTEAHVTFSRFRKAFRHEIGSDLEPSVLQDFQQALSDHQAARRMRPFAASPAVPTGRHRLPGAATPLVGREKDMLDLLGRMVSVRLVTLIGMGGIGKTRLALAVAERVSTSLAEEVVFLDVSPLTDRAQFAPALVEAFGLRAARNASPLEAVLNYLRTHRAFLVVDNCEHLAAACADLLGKLLAACPGLRVLTTSRKALGAPGESVWPVLPLGVPEPGEAVTAQTLLAYEAVALFVQGALRLRPAFTVNADNAGSVAKLCQRLDGIPLAIELASTWSAVLTPSQMLARLTRRLESPSGGNAAHGDRHPSLQAALESTFALLDPPLSRFFARLTVFRGGWTLDAAQAVCEEEGALGLLALLQQRALITSQEAKEEMRFAMLETLRSFAGEQMTEEEKGELGRRHAAFFRAWVEPGDNAQEPAERSAWIVRLEGEQANLNAALAWMLETTGEEDAGLRLATHLSELWYERGRYEEGREWLEKALSKPATQEDGLARARALHRLETLDRLVGAYEAAHAHGEEALALFESVGNRKGVTDMRNNLAILHTEQGDYEVAQRLYLQCQSEYEALGDAAGIARCIHNLGALAFFRHDLDAAKQQYQDALTRRLALGDVEDIADTLTNLGNIAWMQGDLRQALGRYEESLALYRTLGLERGITSLLINVGAVASAEGDYARALRSYEECLALVRRSGDQRMEALLLNNLGESLCYLGDFAEARVQLRLGVGLSQQMGHAPFAIECLDGLAWVNAGEQRWQEAATLYAAAERLRAQHGIAMSEADAARRSERVEAARQALGEGTFAANQAEGSRMTLEEAVAFSR